VGKLYDPEPGIKVETDEQGRPAALAWQTREPVREVINRYRVDDDWWRVPISRTYYTVRTPTALLEVYRDDRAGDWCLQRVIN
jgi:hypothetical protein